MRQKCSRWWKKNIDTWIGSERHKRVPRYTRDSTASGIDRILRTPRMRESVTGSCWAEANAGAIGDRPRKEPERFSRAPCVCESVTDLSRDSERPHKADGYSLATNKSIVVHWTTRGRQAELCANFRTRTCSGARFARPRWQNKFRSKFRELEDAQRSVELQKHEAAINTSDLCKTISRA